MAKRTRYPSRTTARSTSRRASEPGSASIVRRPPPAGEPHDHDHDHSGHDHSHGGPAARSGGNLTEAEVERAAQLEAEVTAREKAAIAASLRRKSRGEASDAWAGDVNAPLSVRASHEYAYVARDVKRIALTATLMASILAVLHILVNVLEVVSL